jgi:REP element-mobilizing transposase RayT
MTTILSLILQSIKEEIVFSKEHAEFLTVTCLEWKCLLVDESCKDIITQSLTYLAKAKRIYVYGFVIMPACLVGRPNHFHLIWQMMGDNIRSEVQRDFLKFTGQQILKKLHLSHPHLANELIVNAKDRKHQVWERNSLGIPLWSPEVFWQKLDYIQNNPVKAGLYRLPEDYKYSSARFYERNEKDWVFLTHHNG